MNPVGPDHPFTAAGLDNLGKVLRLQGDPAAGLDNLGKVLRLQGDPAAARPLFERALAIRDRVLGPDHPDTVATRRALAELAADDGWPGAGG